MFKIRLFAALLASLTTLHMTQGSGLNDSDTNEAKQHFNNEVNKLISVSDLENELKGMFDDIIETEKEKKKKLTKQSKTIMQNDNDNLTDTSNDIDDDNSDIEVLQKSLNNQVKKIKKKQEKKNLTNQSKTIIQNGNDNLTDTSKGIIKSGNDVINDMIIKEPNTDDNNDSSNDNSNGGDNINFLNALTKENDNDNDNDNKAIQKEVKKLEEAKNSENKKKTSEPSNNNIFDSFIDINGDSNDNNNINGTTSDSSTTIEQAMKDKVKQLETKNKIQNNNFIAKIKKQTSDNKEAMDKNDALTGQVLNGIAQQGKNIKNLSKRFEQQNNNNINALNEQNRQFMNKMDILSNDLNRQTMKQAKNDTQELKTFANEKINEARNMVGLPSQRNNSYKRFIKKSNNNSNNTFQPNTNANNAPITAALMPKNDTTINSSDVDLDEYLIKPNSNKTNSPSNNFSWQNAKTPEPANNNNISLENQLNQSQFTYPGAEEINSDDNDDGTFDFNGNNMTSFSGFSNNNNNTGNNLRTGEPSVMSLANSNLLSPKKPTRRDMNKNNRSYASVDFSDDNINKEYKPLQRNILVDNNNDNNNNNIKRLPSYTSIVPSDDNSTNENKENTRRNSNVNKNRIPQPSILTPPKPDTSSDDTKSVPGGQSKKTQQKDLKTENNNETPSNVDPKTVVGLLIVGALGAGAIYAAVGNKNKKSDK